MFLCTFPIVDTKKYTTIQNQKSEPTNFKQIIKTLLLKGTSSLNQPLHDLKAAFKRKSTEGETMSRDKAHYKFLSKRATPVAEFHRGLCLHNQEIKLLGGADPRDLRCLWSRSLIVF